MWNTVVGILLDRTRLDEGLERYFSRQRIETTREEIEYIQSQITELDVEDELLYQAYKARAFDADEYAQKRFALKEQKQRLEDSKALLQKRLLQQASKQERKQQILESIEELKRQAQNEAPFALKRLIIMKVVDKVTVNSREEWYELEGGIAGKFNFNRADTGFARRSE